MENNPWELLSPTTFTFRAYGVEDKRALIMNAVEAALEQFRFCDAIQIDITAPAREPFDTVGAEGRKNNHHSAETVVKGFAG